MFLGAKIGGAALAFALLSTGMLAQGFPQGAARADSKKGRVAVFIVKDEIKKMQETLRHKGHYRGNVDGVFGLQTRASIRAYQKAQNLPITGEVDARTADSLGVRPESKWDNSRSAGREVGHASDIIVGGETKRDKPSAGIRRSQDRTIKTSRQEVSRAVAIEDKRARGADKQQAENEEHDQ